jgi:peptidoglycan hydrolase CwlO-like protein
MVTPLQTQKTELTKKNVELTNMNAELANKNAEHHKEIAELKETDDTPLEMVPMKVDITATAS